MPFADQEAGWSVALRLLRARIATVWNLVSHGKKRWQRCFEDSSSFTCSLVSIRQFCRHKLGIYNDRGLGRSRALPENSHLISTANDLVDVAGDSQ